MSRCYECRADVPSDVFVCDACALTRAQRRSLASAVDKLRGLHGQRGVGGAKVHLSQAERKSIERYTGIPVVDAQDARRALAATGQRFVEKGEEVEEVWAAQEEYARSNGRARGLPSPTLDKSNWYWHLGIPKPKPVDSAEFMRQTLRELHQRRTEEEP